MLHTLTPSQCRAARAMLRWSIDRLAYESGVSAKTINNFELERNSPIRATLDAMRRALEAGGAGFTPAADDHGPGVYERPAQAKSPAD